MARWVWMSVGLVMLLPGILGANDYQLAVVAPRGQSDLDRWKPLATYLSAATSSNFTVVVMPPARIGRAFQSNQISVAIMNPVSTLEVLQAGLGRQLATLKIDGLSRFAGVIFAKAGSGIATIADLKGRRVMAFQTDSAGAYVFQMYYALRNGLQPSRDFSQLRQANNQDDIVTAVRSGLVDVGFVRSGLLETLAQEGKIKLSDFAIVDAKRDEMKLVHSTPLYPEWQLVVANNLEPALTAQIQAAAFALRPNHPAARSAAIDGFVEPQDLSAVREALRALKIPPFDK